MKRFFASLFRITTRSAFLAIALLLGLIFWYLPDFLNLDEFRPSLVELLESTFHCKVLVGRVTGQLVPNPGLVVGRVVFLVDASAAKKTPRILASVNSVRLQLSMKDLLHGRLKIDTIRFAKPRIIAHYENNPAGEKQWTLLALPHAESSKESRSINEWQIRNGTVEVWDHTTRPTSKWVADQFTGSYQVRAQTGKLVGKFARLGRQAMVDLRYDGSAAFPLQTHCSNVELSTLQFLMHTQLFKLEGVTDLLIKSRFKPNLEVHTKFDQPAGAGQVAVILVSAARAPVRWSAQGKHSHLKGTDFELPEWSAKGDAQGVAVYARAETAQNGMLEVTWTQPVTAKDASLDVDLSSVTIRQVLDIFKLHSMHPIGYEPWLIERGSMQALVHNRATLEVTESDVDLAGMHLDLTGTFDLTKNNPQAHIQGDLQHVPMVPLVESFFTPPSPITGTGQADFTLAFPLSASWIQGLNGPIQLEIDSGVLRALKTIYRIMAVLNLGNYLRMRLPQVTAKGIEFESVKGHVVFQNGVLSSDDLFLKSPNMNIGAKGSLNIPAKTIDSTLRLEMFRFLEDILKYVPITHWIFKKPNKIFLPLVVSVDGPWDNVDIH